MSFEPSPVSSSLPVCAARHGIAAQEAGQMDRAVVLWNQVLTASNDLIRARFELGAVVHEALKASAYGDGVVVRLAARLSASSGKLVTPALLYEVARLYAAFGGQYGRVDELRRRLRFPLTYTYLVRTCVPILTPETAWNTGEWDVRQSAELSRMEQAVLHIEDRFAQHQAARAAQIPAQTDTHPESPVEGFHIVCQQSSAYQDLAIHTLSGRIHEALGHLERKASVLTVRDRQQLQEFAARLLRLVQTPEAGAVITVSAA